MCPTALAANAAQPGKRPRIFFETLLWLVAVILTAFDICLRLLTFCLQGAWRICLKLLVIASLVAVGLLAYCVFAAISQLLATFTTSQLP